MTKANLGLGVLALPSVFGVLGLVPGIIIILVIQSMIAYCGLAIGTFKVNHPEVYGLSDAGRVFGGRFGREFFYVVFQIFMLFIIGSALVGISTSLNAVSTHGTCTAVFVAVAAVAGFLFGSIRTLSKVTWIGWVGIFSIMASILTLTIAVGVQDRPNDAPQTGPWDKELQVFGKPTFAQAMSAINGIVFSYGATPMYFGIVSEMKNPRVYARSMVASVFFLTVVYLIIGSVVYSFAGKYVASPALGTAGPLLKKVCYGIAIPGLLASLTIFSHLAGKNLFVRILKGSYHLNHSTKTHWITWLSCVFASVIVGYIIASAIPIFGTLISLIGALVCPLVCFIPYNLCWLHDNWRLSNVRTTKRRMGLYLNCLLLVLGTFLLVAGTYGAIMDLIDVTKGPIGKPWGCADNSGSVKEE
jgi:amino acid permease